MKNSTSFEEQKVVKYIQKNVYFGIIVFSCLSSTKPCFIFLLICFSWEIKGISQRSLGNEIDFRAEWTFPQISWRKNKISKYWHVFVDERALLTTTLIFFLSLEKPCTFLLVKEKTWKYIFNTNSELLKNCTEKQIRSSKTTVNWIFNDIWSYLFIAWFDWKIGVFQQTVVRVYYILKKTINIISDKVHDKLRKTNLKKRTTKKLLLNSCTKTTFSFDNVLYEQVDGISMRSYLGPVLANIILTQFENVILKPLIETGLFCCRYIDDTLVTIKKDKVQHVLNSFNSFDKQGSN